MSALPTAATAALAALALVAPATASAQTRPYDDAAYFAFADRMQQRLDRLWDEQRGYYHGGGGGADPMINSLLLLDHSVAAMSDHPARPATTSGRAAWPSGSCPAPIRDLTGPGKDRYTRPAS